MITEEEKKEAFYNHLKTNLEYSRGKINRKKIIFLISITTIAMSFIFIYFVGGIYIPYSAGYQRYYDVQLNNVQLSTLSQMPSRPIIKNLIYLSSSGTSILHWPTSANEDDRKLEANRYVLSIQSYSCYYSSNYPSVIVDCQMTEDNSQFKKQNTDTKYNKLRIYSYKDYEDIIAFGEIPTTYDKNVFYNIIYDGKYIDDITEYISEKGQYAIEIEAKYSFNIQHVTSVIHNDGNNIVVF